MDVYNLVYVTANDTLFFKDLMHFRHMLKQDPGVAPVRVYLVIAKTKPYTTFQEKMLHILMNMLSCSGNYSPKAMIFRSNAGRDFGSVYDTLRIIGKDANPDDYIFIRNRSARGPFKPNWFKAFVEQSMKSSNTALTGNTISWNDHPKRKLTENVRHVQTYAYLSQWKYMQTLMQDFPGKNAKDHLEAVLQGEIELSQQFMQKGYKITSLQYPDLWLDTANQNEIQKENYVAVDQAELPFHNLNPPRTPGYYLNALSLLPFLARYRMTGKPSYEIITLS